MGAGAAVPARPELEAAIARIWSEILHRDDLGSEQDFFELGGDSLAAVRMLAALDEALTVSVDFTDFLDGATISALASAVARSRASARVEHGRSPVTDPPPAAGTIADELAGARTTRCSFAQERLWFLEQLGAAPGAYNMPLGLRLRGALDERALRDAIVTLVQRHDALRTTFAMHEGLPVAVTHSSLAPDFELVDLSARDDRETAAAELLDALASDPIPLAGDSLMRCRLIRLAPEEHILELVLHHIICDGASHVVLMAELGELYSANAAGREPELPAPSGQYPEFAASERRTLDGDALRREVEPWLERLAGSPAALELPVDRERPAEPTYRGATYRLALPAATTAAVRAFARAHRATPFATLLAGYCALLYRHTGQSELVIGTTTAARDTAELAGGVGLYASTVALALDASGSSTFAELVSQARETVLWSIAHQRAPFDQIVAQLGLERDLARHPLFQVFCAHVPRVNLELEGLEVEPYDVHPSTSRFDLTLFVEDEAQDAIELAWEYSYDLFEPATIEALAHRYVRLLEAALSDAQCSIDSLPLLDDDERALLIEAGTPARSGFAVACMHERFEAQAARDPEAIGLVHGDVSLTYGDLNARANRLAHHLRSLGVGAETRVALCFEPSVEMIVSILGVLKAGGAYVPLDPEHPRDRTEFVLGDAGAAALLTERSLLDRLPETGVQVFCWGRDDDALRTVGAENPESRSAPDNAAYVIYTSGSTGRPKGVLVEHRQVARLLTATDAWYGFGREDRWVLLHSYAFDFSVWELWGALAYGGRLVISPAWTTRSPAALGSLLVDHGVTVLNITPSLFAAVQDDLLRRAPELRLRYVVFGGEALKPPALRPWFERFANDGPTLVNMYGITETTVHVTYRPLTAADCEEGVSPIGVPIPDLGLFILDPSGAPVPDGVAGELYVAGAGLARGYLGREQLNAERFIPNPFGPGRLYRTGDAARRLASGELEFRGRIDDQVKIRGYRIELGEIESVIRDVPGVADCAVVPVSVGDDLRLAGYVVPEPARGEGPLRELIARELADRLPAYMAPAGLVLIDRLPLTRNGKIDRRALPEPSWEQRHGDQARAPQTTTELVVAEIWCSVLGVQRVGADDDFFNLGGHSLLAARVATQVRERCQADISVRALFSAPTLSGFSREVDAARGSADAARGVQPASTVSPSPAFGAPPPNPERSGRPELFPLSFSQQQLVFLDQLMPGSPTYNAALATRVAGPLDVDALRRALRTLFERQHALRSVLEWDDETPMQRLLTGWDLQLPIVDLSAVDPPQQEAELRRQMVTEGRRPFDLESDLMLRVTLYRLGEEEHVLLCAPHHLAFDAWAVDVLYQELAELYDAERSGRQPRLPALEAQFRDFARLEREQLRGERLDSHLRFWRSQLAGAPTLLRLATDRPRADHQTFEGETLQLDLDTSLATAVGEMCGRGRATPYIVLLAAFATLLYRESGQDDILFGGPMANREQPGFENLIGFFANTIVVRVRLDGNPSFSDLVARVRESVLASYEHQEVPLELVVDAVRPERDPAANPLFQVNFRVRVGELPELALTGARTASAPVDLGLARFDLAVELHQLSDRIQAEFNFNTALFVPATIKRLARDFEALLRRLLADPDARLLSHAVPSDDVRADPSVDAPGKARPIRRERRARL